METVQSINSNIRAMYDLLEKLEKTYEEKLSLSEQRRIVERKTDIKINQLIKSQQIKDKITISAAGTLFQTSKEKILNCKYENILKNMLIKNEFTPQSEYDIFLDIEAEYFEKLIQIIRLSQLQNEDSSEIKQLENYLGYFNKKSASKNQKCVLDVQLTELIDRPIHLKEIIKKFFYADWEKIIQEFGVIE